MACSSPAAREQSGVRAGRGPGGGGARLGALCRERAGGAARRQRALAQRLVQRGHHLQAQQVAQALLALSHS
jgi:hypothetical protein